MPKRYQYADESRSLLHAPDNAEHEDIVDDDLLHSDLVKHQQDAFMFRRLAPSRTVMPARIQCFYPTGSLESSYVAIDIESTQNKPDDLVSCSASEIRSSLQKLKSEFSVSDLDIQNRHHALNTRHNFSFAQLPQKIPAKARAFKAFLQLMTKEVRQTQDMLDYFPQDSDSAFNNAAWRNYFQTFASLYPESADQLQALEKMRQLDSDAMDEEISSDELAEESPVDSMERKTRKTRAVDFLAPQSERTAENVDRLPFATRHNVPELSTTLDVNWFDTVSLDQVLEDNGASFHIRYRLPLEEPVFSDLNEQSSAVPVFSIENLLGTQTGRVAWRLIRTSESLLSLEYVDEYGSNTRGNDGMLTTTYEEVVSGKIEVEAAKSFLDQIENQIRHQLNRPVTETYHQEWCWQNQGRENPRPLYLVGDVSIPNSARGDVSVWLPALSRYLRIDELMSDDGGFVPPLLYKVVGNRNIFYRPDESFRLIINSDDAGARDVVADIHRQIQEIATQDLASFAHDSRTEITVHPQLSSHDLQINSAASVNKTYRIGNADVNVTVAKFPTSDVTLVFDRMATERRPRQISMRYEVLPIMRFYQPTNETKAIEISAALSNAKVLIIGAAEESDSGGVIESVLTSIRQDFMEAREAYKNAMQPPVGTTSNQKWLLVSIAVNNYSQWAREKADQFSPGGSFLESIPNNPTTRELSEYREYLKLVYSIHNASVGYEYDRIPDANWATGQFNINGKNYDIGTSVINRDVIDAWFAHAKNTHVENQIREDRELQLIGEYWSELQTLHARNHLSQDIVAQINACWRTIPEPAQRLADLVGRSDWRFGGAYSETLRSYRNVMNESAQNEHEHEHERLSLRQSQAQKNLIYSVLRGLHFQSQCIRETENDEQADQWYQSVYSHMIGEFESARKPFQTLLTTLQSVVPPVSENGSESAETITLVKFDNVELMGRGPSTTSIPENRSKSDTAQESNTWQKAAEAAPWVGIGSAAVVFIAGTGMAGKVLSAELGNAMIAGATAIGGTAALPALVLGGISFVPLASFVGAEATAAAYLARAAGLDGGREVYVAALESGGVLMMACGAFAAMGNNLRDGNYKLAILDAAVGIATLQTGAPALNQTTKGLLRAETEAATVQEAVILSGEGRGPLGPESFADGADIRDADGVSIITVDSESPSTDGVAFPGETNTISIPQAGRPATVWEKVKLASNEVSAAPVEDKIALSGAAAIPVAAGGAVSLEPNATSEHQERSVWDWIMAMYRRGPPGPKKVKL